MKTRVEKGIYGNGIVYTIETLEDWKEYEITRNSDPEWMKYNHSNLLILKEEFKNYIGKTWEDEKNIKYCFNGEPVYTKYKIVALEDNEPWADYYWIVKNIDNEKDVKSLLANDADFKKHIIDL